MNPETQNESARNVHKSLRLTRILIPYEDAVRLLRIRDTYDWHQRAWQAFGGRDGKPRDFLARVDRLEETFRLLLLSETAPEKPQWCPTHCYSSQTIPEEFFSHDRYGFSLLANPTRKVRSNQAGERTKNGRRVALTRREDLAAWLQRKADVGGFEFPPESLRAIPKGREFFHKDHQMRGAHAAVEFKGILTVRDRSRFRTTVAKGIGSAKAFGFGLLALTPLGDLTH